MIVMLSQSVGLSISWMFAKPGKARKIEHDPGNSAHETQNNLKKLAWSRFGVEPDELSDVVANREVAYFDSWGCCPARLARGKLNEIFDNVFSTWWQSYHLGNPENFVHKTGKRRSRKIH